MFFSCLALQCGAYAEKQVKNIDEQYEMNQGANAQKEVTQYQTNQGSVARSTTPAEAADTLNSKGYKTAYDSKTNTYIVQKGSEVVRLTPTKGTNGQPNSVEVKTASGRYTVTATGTPLSYTVTSPKFDGTVTLSDTNGEQAALVSSKGYTSTVSLSPQHDGSGTFTTTNPEYPNGPYSFSTYSGSIEVIDSEGHHRYNSAAEFKTYEQEIRLVAVVHMALSVISTIDAQ